MAIMPNVIMISLKSGTDCNASLACGSGLPTSIHLKMINNKKEILQIKATLDKNLTIFILKNVDDKNAKILF